MDVSLGSECASIVNYFIMFPFVYQLINISTLSPEFLFYSVPPWTILERDFKVPHLDNIHIANKLDRMSLHKKSSFPLRISSVNVSSPLDEDISINDNFKGNFTLDGI